MTDREQALGKAHNFAQKHVNRDYKAEAVPELVDLLLEWQARGVEQAAVLLGPIMESSTDRVSAVWLGSVLELNREASRLRAQKGGVARPALEEMAAALREKARMERAQRGGGK